MFIAGNNLVSKPMPKGRQLKQTEGSRSLTQDRRVMPLLSPPRSDSLKDRRSEFQLQQQLQLLQQQQIGCQEELQRDDSIPNWSEEDQ